MKRNTIIVCAMLSLAVPARAGGIPVIDAQNLAIAQQNAVNTGKIMDSNKTILDKSASILKALSGSRDGSMGLGSQRLDGGMSVAQAPAFGSVLNGGTLSFGGLGQSAQQMAALIINKLRLVKQIQSTVQGQAPTSVNIAYGNGVNTSALLSALGHQASQGAAARASALNAASGQIGQAVDVKGSVDSNTRMQLETAGIINEAVGVQTGILQALNQQNQDRLIDQSQTARMTAFHPVDPFA